MRWWQNAFSSSTSSSSASSSSSLSSKVHSDDSLIPSSTGGGIRYTLKSAFFFARRRRHARAKKFQNLAENDVDDWRSHYSENENLSSSKCSSSSNRRPPPQPLPLPELQLLLRHDADAAVSNEPSVPLPSPTDAHNSHHKTGEERDEDTHKDGVASHGRYTIFFLNIFFSFALISHRIRLLLVSLYSYLFCFNCESRIGCLCFFFEKKTQVTLIRSVWFSL